MHKYQKRFYGSARDMALLMPLVSGPAFMVYATMAGHASWKDGSCVLAITTIVGLVGLSESTVHRAIDELIAVGIIDREWRYVGGRQRANRWRLMMAVNWMRAKVMARTRKLQAMAMRARWKKTQRSAYRRGWEDCEYQRMLRGVTDDRGRTQSNISEGEGGQNWGAHLVETALFDKKKVPWRP